MMKMISFSSRWPILFAAILTLTITLLFSACLPYGRVGEYGSGSFQSNGERIYFTAESASGQPITYSGSIRMMHSITCANCHGPEGKGGRVNMMMSYFDSPDITWHVLTQEEGHNEEPGKGEHEEHPPYTEETLRRAITKGLDPAGEPLDDEMPRWRMSEQDLTDLADFIKTLD